LIERLLSSYAVAAWNDRHGREAAVDDASSTSVSTQSGRSRRGRPEPPDSTQTGPSPDLNL
jgi:hypothetical protein